MQVRGRRVVLAVAVALLTTAGVASANVPLTTVSTDSFTNATSQHRTEVEPDTFAWGSRIVSAFQVGRFFDGGATDIGFATSPDGGATWTAGSLPGLTFNASGASVPFERVSDASVAFDLRHNAWLVSSIPILPDTSVPKVAVNRSLDGGLSWSQPGSCRTRWRRRSISTRTGRRATTIPRARSTATATPSSTTSPPATWSS